MRMFAPSAHYDGIANLVKVQFFDVDGNGYWMSIPEDVIVREAGFSHWGYSDCVNFVVKNDRHFVKYAQVMTADNIYTKPTNQIANGIRLEPFGK